MIAAPAAPVPATVSGVRILLVDDSSVVRRILSEVVGSEPGLVLAGTASSGRQALAVIDDLKPHVVVLDVEMPDIDGRETLVEIMRRWPALPVVMFSSVSDRAAAATLDALARGAKDFVTKPSMVGSLPSAVAAVRSSLVPIVRTWGEIALRRDSAQRIRARAAAAPVAHAPATPPPVPPPVLRGLSTGRVAALLLASSTGGPTALHEVVPALPANLPVPVLLVQHMPVTFTRHLAERLDGVSAIRVHEAEPGMAVEAGHLYVARGGEHMEVRRHGTGTIIELTSAAPENSCRPAADVLFRSAVARWGGDLLAVVLTGMGQDGMLGARAVVEAGGDVIAQDAETSVVWGMPGAVARAGLAGKVLPLADIAPAVARRITSGKRLA